LHKPLYGDFATRNHQGDLFDAGKGTVDFLKDLLPGYSQLSDLQSLQRILSGCGTAEDYLSLLPYAGDILGRVAKNAKKIDNLKDVSKKLDDLDHKPKPKNEINCANSFVAGTEVLTPDGVKSIEDIEVGDWVIADDPTTVGEIEAKRVLELFQHSDYQLLDLVIDGETISVTPNHEFWVVDSGIKFL
jgi:hypothetical protein